jgi:hypothetical protein
MPITINGTNGITFNDATTQTKAGLTGSTSQLCQAWVNFNGTTASPSTIRASYNVGSVTKNATGDYTVNFTTAMADANYAVTGLAQYQNLVGQTLLEGPNNPTTTSVRVLTKSNANITFDSLYVSVAIYR